MPKLVQQVSVFISCPSDLTAEKNAAREVVNEVNRLLGQDSALALQAITAEDDVVAGVGTDPQDVVNQQLPSYDIYVGMMGTRFGSPTPRAGSGTEEEFESALRRHDDVEPVDIIFLFSCAPVVPDQLDLKQVARIRRLKNGMSNKGVYYKEFATLEELKTHLRQGLLYYAKQWEGRLSGGERPTVPQDDSTVVLREIDDDVEAGPLDFLAEMEEAITSSGAILDGMGQASEKLGSSLGQRTQELNALTNVAGAPSYKRIRKVVDQSANDLVDYASSVETSIPGFRSTMGVFTDRSARLLSTELQSDTAIEELQQAREGFGGLADGMASAFDSLSDLRETIAGTPAPTSSFRKAVRRALAAMDDLLGEIRGQKLTLDQVLASLDSSIERKQGAP